MVRTRVRTIDELRHVWGISEKRLSNHGQLMLEALAPFLPALDLNAANGEEQRADGEDCPDPALGDGRPHLQWMAEAGRSGLPDGPWENRRTFCFSEYNCKACERHGDGSAWAVQSQQLLGRLRELYGSYDECQSRGWRWFASPNHSQGSHNHKWWPPLSMCNRLGLHKMPMGTRAVLAMLDQIV